MKRSPSPRASASTRIEILEARIAPATLYVDNPADITIVNDTGAAGLSNGDLVQWDAGASSVHPRPPIQVFGTHVFSSIVAAIAAANPADTIRVAGGTFNEVVVVNKTVTLLGNQAGIMTGARLGLPESIVQAQNAPPMQLTANAVEVDGFAISGLAANNFTTPPQLGMTTSGAASGYIIENNFISGGSDFTTSGAAGMSLAGNGVLLTVVAHNMISGGSTSFSEAPGLSITGTLANARIEANNFSSFDGVGILFQPATGAGSGEVAITRNVFTGGSSFLSSSGGIVVGSSTSEGTVLSITENFFTGHDTAIAVGAIPAGTKVTIRSNSFTVGEDSITGTPGFAISSAAAQLIDARYNWYGTTDPAEVDAQVSGNVDFEPFLLVGEDARAAIAGFQSVPSLQLLKPGVATLLDTDGDVITIKVSKGELSGENFSVVLAGPGDGVRLEELLISGPGFAGANVSVSAKRSALGGDNAVNVETVRATGMDLGAVAIGGDLGRIFAGNPAEAADALKSLIAHSIGRFDVTGFASGAVVFSSVHGAVGSLTVRGNIENAAFQVVGDEDSDLRGVKLGGSLVGGTLSADGDIGNVVIRGSIFGANEAFHGGINARENLGNVTLGGSLIGKSFTGTAVGGSAFILSHGNMGFVKIGGSVVAAAEGSARIWNFEDDPQLRHRIAGVTIAGNLIGGPDGFSGAISSAGLLGPVKIGGDVRGVDGTGTEDAEIRAGNGVTSILISGSLVGAGTISGNIFITGSAGPITIKGNIIGGSDNSGMITVSDGADPAAGASLKSLTVGHWLIGAEGSSVNSAGVIVRGPLGPVKIGGSMISGSSFSIGGEVRGSASIHAESITKVNITGSLLAAPSHVMTNFIESASIVSETTLGPVTIGGDMIGTENTRPQILARGLQSGGGIANVKIAGDARFGLIGAGYAAGTIASSGAPILVNTHAQIGAVTVGGDWIATNLVAGIDSADGFFGNADDTALTNGLAGPRSKVASVTIKGSAAGTVAWSFDHYGIVAQEIAKVIINGVKLPLTPGPGNDDLSATNLLFLIGPTNDFRVHEVPS